MTRIAALPCSLVLLLASCHSAPARPQLTNADYPGVLREPESLQKNIVWQQHVTANWGKQASHGFDAVVQKVGDTLTVMGLSPLGSMGFAAILKDGKIEMQNQSGQELPFPPRFIVLDVQRAFYPWFEAAPNGVSEAIVDGERIHETWAGGKLRERRFERCDGKPAGAIVAHYEWAHADWHGPSRVVLDNGWFGYQLVVETHAETLVTGNGEAR